MQLIPAYRLGLGMSLDRTEVTHVRRDMEIPMFPAYIYLKSFVGLS